MIDKKLTDEEIIQSLGQCASDDGGCVGCVLKDMHCANCIRRLQAESLNLINRQKAEIEKLQEEFLLIFEKMESEYDAKIKAEACKEFAERLKQHKRKMRGFDLNEEFWDYAVLVENIDEVLKEMEEEKKWSEK